MIFTQHWNQIMLPFHLFYKKSLLIVWVVVWHSTYININPSVSWFWSNHMENIHLKCLGSGVSSQKCVCIEPINPQIAKFSRNVRTYWYIFGVSNSKKWYILAFGAQTNILTPLSLYPLSLFPSPPPPPPRKQHSVAGPVNRNCRFCFNNYDSTSLLLSGRRAAKSEKVVSAGTIQNKTVLCWQEHKRAKLHRSRFGPRQLWEGSIQSSWKLAYWLTAFTGLLVKATMWKQFHVNTTQYQP